MATREKHREYEAVYRERNKERLKEINRNKARAYRERKKNDPTYRARVRSERFKAWHGLTLAEVDAMIAAQGGKCAVCERLPRPTDRGGRLHVDHCHKTKRIRGMLCAYCNMALGLVMDSPEILEKLAAYLRK